MKSGMGWSDVVWGAWCLMRLWMRAGDGDRGKRVLVGPTKELLILGWD